MFLHKIGLAPSPLCTFCEREIESIEHLLTLSRPGGGGGGGGLLEPAPTLKICNFQTVKAITTKCDDFS